MHSEVVESPFELCSFSAALCFNRADFNNGLKERESAEKDFSTVNVFDLTSLDCTGYDLS